jgi:succinoglycan biosynthesis transport protein ExoP
MNEPAQPQGGMDLSLLVHALRQQRWTILAFLGAAVLAALGGSLVATPQYQAVAVIQLLPTAGKELDVRAVVDYEGTGYLERRDQARTQIQILLSRSLREEVLHRYKTLGYDDIPADAEGAGILKEALSAGPKEDTQLVEIKVLHPDPERAAVLANLVATVYQDSNLEQRTGTARETRVWLEDQSEGYQTALEKANQKLIDFKQTYGLVDIEEKVDDITHRLASLQAELGAVTTERVMLSSALNEYEGLLAAGRYTVIAGMIDDPTLEAMTRQRADAMAYAAQVMAEYTDQHPEYQRAAWNVTRIEQLLAEEVVGRVESDRARLRILLSQEQSLQYELARVKEELLEKQRLKEEYDDLKQEADRVRRLYQSLGDRGEEVELQSMTRLNNVRMIDPALPPGRPATPNIPLNLAMAMVVGLAGGLGLALLRYRLSDKILTSEDIERSLTAPLLGSLPTLPDGLSDKARGLYSYKHPRSLSAEAFRSVRETLHINTATGRPYRLLVTSSLGGEGKSTAAIGLAVAFSRLGVRTLLLDADLHHPHQHAAFGIQRVPGLSEALTEAERFAHVTPTQIANLDLLTCGELVEDPRAGEAAEKPEQPLPADHHRQPAHRPGLGRAGPDPGGERGDPGRAPRVRHPPAAGQDPPPAGPGQRPAVGDRAQRHAPQP